MSELNTAIKVAKEAGAFLKSHFYADKKIDTSLQHDIKLALDVETQNMIESSLAEVFPDYAFYGEEGITGDPNSPNQWIVDPIDGTVNYFHQIPHFCVSIALRKQGELTLGVIYDPMMDELWAVEKGSPATLNGKVIQCSPRENLKECICFIGHGNTAKSMENGIEKFSTVCKKVRKMRITGSSALAMAYVASGRYDAYMEGRICLWDIAAGQLLVEAAGGTVTTIPHPTDQDKLQISATNGKINASELSLT